MSASENLDREVLLERARGGDTNALGTLFELCRLNYIAGAVYAEAALALLAKSRVRREDLEVIGYDGQTIYQEPPDHARLAAARKGSLVDRWLDEPRPSELSEQRRGRCGDPRP